MDRAMKAAQLFESGYNCAQAVAVAFADVLGMEEKEAAVRAGVRTISFAMDGLGTDLTCSDLTEVPGLLASM